MKNPFRASFPLQMALATLFGIGVGLFFGEGCRLLQPWSAAYVMILKITALPYLIVAIIHGMSLLNRGQAMQILKKGFLFIALALFINICIIYLIYWTLPSVEGPRQTGYLLKEVPALKFADLLIPDNIFYDLANNIVPAIVVFSLLIGIALMHLAEKQAFILNLQVLLDVLTKITSWIARITPLGTFIIMSYQVGTVQFSVIKLMGSYLLLYAIGTCLITFWIVPRLANTLTPIKALTWLKNLSPVLVLVYTTGLVIVALPYIINTIKAEVQKLYPKDENIQGQIQGTVSIIFNLPLGSIFTSAFVLFASVFFSSPLYFADQIKLFVTTFLTSLGAVGMGSWINSLTFILDTLGLPIEGINMYLTIVPFTAGFQTLVSAMMISTLALLITLAGRGLLSITWKKMIFGNAFTILPVLLIFGGIKWLEPLPKMRNNTKTLYDLEIESHISSKIYKRSDLLPTNANAFSSSSALHRILSTKTLKVGYDPHTAPLCFFNHQQKLVGFDIAYAYQLAYDLGCFHIEFIPVQYKTLGIQLSSGTIDIAMSAISISEERLKEMAFPSPILEPKIVFVTKDHERKRYSNLEDIKNDTSIRLAALANTAYESILSEQFSRHEIILLESYDQFLAENPPADLLLWEEQEAIGWITMHPKYHIVFPKPNLGKQSLGYPIQAGDGEFLAYLNAWLKLKESEGFKQEQYNLWILGKTQVAAPTGPRWSVWKDILKK